MSSRKRPLGHAFRQNHAPCMFNQEQPSDDELDEDDTSPMLHCEDQDDRRQLYHPREAPVFSDPREPRFQEHPEMCQPQIDEMVQHISTYNPVMREQLFREIRPLVTHNDMVNILTIFDAVPYSHIGPRFVPGMHQNLMPYMVKLRNLLLGRVQMQLSQAQQGYACDARVDTWQNMHGQMQSNMMNRDFPANRNYPGHRFQGRCHFSNMSSGGGPRSQSPVPRPETPPMLMEILSFHPRFSQIPANQQGYGSRTQSSFFGEDEMRRFHGDRNCSRGQSDMGGFAGERRPTAEDNHLQGRGKFSRGTAKGTSTLSRPVEKGHAPKPSSSPKKGNVKSPRKRNKKFSPKKKTQGSKSEMFQASDKPALDKKIDDEINKGQVKAVTTPKSSSKSQFTKNREQSDRALSPDSSPKPAADEKIIKTLLSLAMPRDTELPSDTKNKFSDKNESVSPSQRTTCRSLEDCKRTGKSSSPMKRKTSLEDHRNRSPKKMFNISPSKRTRSLEDDLKRTSPNEKASSPKKQKTPLNDHKHLSQKEIICRNLRKQITSIEDSMLRSQNEARKEMTSLEEHRNPSPNKRLSRSPMRSSQKECSRSARKGRISFEGNSSARERLSKTPKKNSPVKRYVTPSPSSLTRNRSSSALDSSMVINVDNTPHSDISGRGDIRRVVSVKKRSSSSSPVKRVVSMKKRTSSSSPVKSSSPLKMRPGLDMNIVITTQQRSPEKGQGDGRSPVRIINLVTSPSRSESTTSSKCKSNVPKRLSYSQSKIVRRKMIRKMQQTETLDHIEKILNVEEAGNEQDHEGYTIHKVRRSGQSCVLDRLALGDFLTLGPMEQMVVKDCKENSKAVKEFRDSSTSPKSPYQGLLMAKRELEVLLDVCVENQSKWKQVIPRNSSFPLRYSQCSDESVILWSQSSHSTMELAGIVNKTPEKLAPTARLRHCINHQQVESNCPEEILTKSFTKDQVSTNQVYHMSMVQTNSNHVNNHLDIFFRSSFKTQCQALLKASKQLLLQKHVYMKQLDGADISALNWVHDKISSLDQGSDFSVNHVPSTTSGDQPVDNWQDMMWMFLRPHKDTVSGLMNHVPTILLEASLMTFESANIRDVWENKPYSLVRVPLFDAIHEFKFTQIFMDKELVPFFTVNQLFNHTISRKTMMKMKRALTTDLDSSRHSDLHLDQFLGPPWLAALQSYHRRIKQHLLELEKTVTEQRITILEGNKSKAQIAGIKDATNICATRATNMADLARLLALYLELESATRELRLRRLLGNNRLVVSVVLRLGETLGKLNSVPLDAWAETLWEMIKQHRTSSLMKQASPSNNAVSWKIVKGHVEVDMEVLEMEISDTDETKEGVESKKCTSHQDVGPIEMDDTQKDVIEATVKEPSPVVMDVTSIPKLNSCSVFDACRPIAHSNDGMEAVLNKKPEQILTNHDDCIVIHGSASSDSENTDEVTSVPAVKWFSPIGEMVKFGPSKDIKKPITINLQMNKVQNKKQITEPSNVTAENKHDDTIMTSSECNEREKTVKNRNYDTDQDVKSVAKNNPEISVAETKPSRRNSDTDIDIITTPDTEPKNLLNSENLAVSTQDGSPDNGTAVFEEGELVIVNKDNDESCEVDVLKETSTLSETTCTQDVVHFDDTIKPHQTIPDNNETGKKSALNEDNNAISTKDEQTEPQKENIGHNEFLSTASCLMPQYSLRDGSLPEKSINQAVTDAEPKHEADDGAVSIDPGVLPLHSANIAGSGCEQREPVENDVVVVVDSSIGSNTTDKKFGVIQSLSLSSSSDLSHSVATDAKREKMASFDVRSIPLPKQAIHLPKKKQKCEEIVKDVSECTKTNIIHNVTSELMDIRLEDIPLPGGIQPSTSTPAVQPSKTILDSKSIPVNETLKSVAKSIHGGGKLDGTTKEQCRNSSNCGAAIAVWVSDREKAFESSRIAHSRVNPDNLMNVSNCSTPMEKQGRQHKPIESISKAVPCASTPALVPMPVPILVSSGNDIPYSPNQPPYTCTPPVRGPSPRSFNDAASPEFNFPSPSPMMVPPPWRGPEPTNQPQMLATPPQQQMRMPAPSMDKSLVIANHHPMFQHTRPHGFTPPRFPFENVSIPQQVPPQQVKTQYSTGPQTQQRLVRPPHTVLPAELPRLQCSNTESRSQPLSNQPLTGMCPPQVQHPDVLRPQINPTVRPPHMNPGLHRPQMSTGACPPQVNPCMHSPKISPDVHPSPIRLSMPPHQMNPCLHPSQMSPGMNPSQMAPAMHPTQMNPGMHPPPMQGPGMHPAQMSPGMRPPQMGPGMQPPQHPPQMRPVMQPPQTSPGSLQMSPENCPRNIPPPMMLHPSMVHGQPLIQTFAGQLMKPQPFMMASGPPHMSPVMCDNKGSKVTGHPPIKAMHRTENSEVMAENNETMHASDNNAKEERQNKSKKIAKHDSGSVLKYVPIASNDDLSKAQEKMDNIPAKMSIRDLLQSAISAKKTDWSLVNAQCTKDLEKLPENKDSEQLDKKVIKEKGSLPRACLVKRLLHKSRVRRRNLEVLRRQLKQALHRSRPPAGRAVIPGSPPVRGHHQGSTSPHGHQRLTNHGSAGSPNQAVTSSSSLRQQKKYATSDPDRIRGRSRRFLAGRTGDLSGSPQRSHISQKLPSSKRSLEVETGIPGAKPAKIPCRGSDTRHKSFHEVPQGTRVKSHRSMDRTSPSGSSLPKIIPLEAVASAKEKLQTIFKPKLLSALKSPELQGVVKLSSSQSTKSVRKLNQDPKIIPLESIISPPPQDVIPTIPKMEEKLPATSCTGDIPRISKSAPNVTSSLSPKISLDAADQSRLRTTLLSALKSSPKLQACVLPKASNPEQVEAGPSKPSTDHVETKPPPKCGSSSGYGLISDCESVSTQRMNRIPSYRSISSKASSVCSDISEAKLSAGADPKLERSSSDDVDEDVLLAAEDGLSADDSPSTEEEERLIGMAKLNTSSSTDLEKEAQLTQQETSNTKEANELQEDVEKDVHLSVRQHIDKVINTATVPDSTYSKLTAPQQDEHHEDHLDEDIPMIQSPTTDEATTVMKEESSKTDRPVQAYTTGFQPLSPELSKDNNDVSMSCALDDQNTNPASDGPLEIVDTLNSEPEPLALLPLSPGLTNCDDVGGDDIDMEISDNEVDSRPGGISYDWGGTQVNLSDSDEDLDDLPHYEDALRSLAKDRTDRSPTPDSPRNVVISEPDNVCVETKNKADTMNTSDHSLKSVVDDDEDDLPTVDHVIRGRTRSNILSGNRVTPGSQENKDPKPDSQDPDSSTLETPYDALDPDDGMERLRNKLDNLLTERTTNFQMDKELEAATEELNEGLKRGGINKLSRQDTSTSAGDSQELLPEHRQQLEAYNLREQRIRDEEPGEPVFDELRQRHLFSFPETLTLATCGFTPGKSLLDRTLATADPESLLEVLVSDVVALRFECISCPEAFLDWTFLLLSESSNDLVCDACTKTLLDVLQCDEGKGAHWIPSTINVARALVNYGAELSVLLPSPDMVDFTEHELGLSGNKENHSPGTDRAAPAPEDPAEPPEPIDGFHENLRYILRVVAEAASVRPELYRLEDLQAQTALIMKASLDTSLTGYILKYDMDNALAALFNAVPSNRWKQFLSRLCALAPTLTSHHHNMAETVELLPLTDRGLTAQRHLAYVYLNTLSGRPSPDIDSVKVSLVFPVVQSLHVGDDCDFYRLSSVVRLLDRCVGLQALSVAEKPDLRLLHDRLRSVMGLIRENISDLDRSVVKDLIARLCSKWSIKMDSMGSKQRTIFQFTSTQNFSQSTSMDRVTTASTDAGDDQSQTSDVNADDVKDTDNVVSETTAMETVKDAITADG